MRFAVKAREGSVGWSIPVQLVASSLDAFQVEGAPVIEDSELREIEWRPAAPRQCIKCAEEQCTECLFERLEHLKAKQRLYEYELSTQQLAEPPAHSQPPVPLPAQSSLISSYLSQLSDEDLRQLIYSLNGASHTRV